MQNWFQYSATILILIFKLSSGYLLAVFDPQVHMMLHCFSLLLPVQSWYHAGFVAGSLIIIWYSFLCVSDLVFFCLEAQEFIFLLKSRKFTGLDLTTGHPTCLRFDSPPSQFVIHENSLSSTYFVGITHGLLFCYLSFFYLFIWENLGRFKLSHQCHFPACSFRSF